MVYIVTAAVDQLAVPATLTLHSEQSKGPMDTVASTAAGGLFTFFTPNELALQGLCYAV